MIQSALGRPYSGYHPKIHSKAAAILHGCVSNHGFVDGKKRTAWILTELLIERSGYTLNIPYNEPIDDLVVAIAAGDLTFDALQQWFLDRIRKSDD
ncbi:MAG: Fic family protein [Pseudomonadota bacterium]